MKKILSVVAILFLVTTYGCKQQKEQKPQMSPLAAPGPSPLQIEQMQAATRISPKNAQVWIALGDALMDSRRFNEAVEA
jgi:cytochrome c-type biogenesis protein CcmH/NrfG